MSAALTAWDREIEAARVRIVRQRVANASAANRRRAACSLGRMYCGARPSCRRAGGIRRGQPPRAHACGRPRASWSRARAHGTPTEAIEAFRTALGLDPGDPVTAYYLFHEALISGNTSGAQRGLQGPRRSLPEAPASEAHAQPTGVVTPFIRLAPLPGVAAGPPVLPLAAYSQAFRALAAASTNGAIAEFRKAAAGDPLLADPAAGSGLMVRAFAALRQGRVTDARALLENPAHRGIRPRRIVCSASSTGRNPNTTGASRR